MDILRDPIWQFVGVAIGIVTFIFTVMVEWPTVKTRFENKVIPKKQFTKLIIGTIGGFASGLLGGFIFSLLLNEIGWSLNLYNNYELYSPMDVLFWGIGWSIAGLIFAIFDVEKSTTFREGLSGGFLGALLAMPIGLLISYIVSGFISDNNVFAVTFEISSSIGAAASMVLFGFIYGGFIKKVARFFFGNWIKDE